MKLAWDTNHMTSLAVWQYTNHETLQDDVTQTLFILLRLYYTIFLVGMSLTGAALYTVHVAIVQLTAYFSIN